MIFSKIKTYLQRLYKAYVFKKRATLLGVNYIFGKYSGISLSDGSKSTDIVIYDHVWIYGILQSQNNGKITMEEYTKIGYGTIIRCVNSVTIGAFTAIADNVVISDNNNHPINPEYRLYMRMQPENDDSRKWKHSSNAPIVIGKNCWIGQNVRIQRGVTIGDNSIIAANSVVTKSVPANSIAGGNPAKVLKIDIDNVEPPISCIGFNDWKKEQ